MQFRTTLIGVGALVVIVVAGMFLTGTKKTDLAVLEKCFASETSRQPPGDTCLKKTIETLMVSHTTADILRYVSTSTSPLNVRGSCHQIAHITGEETFIKFGNLEKALSECTTACGSGCLHGAVTASVAKELGGTYLNDDIAHADLDTLKKIGSKYCVEKGRVNLCHGIGHLLYMGTHDFPTALAACDSIAKNHELSSLDPCYQGVFMEGDGSGSSFGTHQEVPPDNDYGFPCTSVGRPYQHACFYFLGEYQRQLFEKNNVPRDQRYEKIVAVCTALPAPARADCFFGVGWRLDFGYQPQEDHAQRAADRCAALPPADADACTVGLSLYYSLYNQYANARTLCRAISDPKRESLCFDVLFQNAPLATTTVNIPSICGRNTNETCSRQYETFLANKDTLPIYRFKLTR